MPLVWILISISYALNFLIGGPYANFYLLSDYVLVLIQGFWKIFSDRILAVAPVSNKALVVVVFPLTIGFLQSWWITYFTGAKKNKGFICCHCSLILFKVCSPFFFLLWRPDNKNVYPGVCSIAGYCNLNVKSFGTVIYI